METSRSFKADANADSNIDRLAQSAADRDAHEAEQRARGIACDEVASEGVET